MSETPVSDELAKTPEQEIRGMGRKILGAIDGIIEEHDWQWSKKPWQEIPIPPQDAPNGGAALGRRNLMASSLSLGRRFDPKNHGTNFNEEAYCMTQVLDRGIIPRVQIPGKPPLPHGILINFRGAPEFILEWSDQERLEKATGVVEELLRKLGFLNSSERLADPSDSKTFHTYDYIQDAEDLQAISEIKKFLEESHPRLAEGFDDREYRSNRPDKKFDYGWILSSSYQGMNFLEIQHPQLPFVADIMPSLNLEPPVVFIRYIPDLQLGKGAEEKAVAAVEEMFRKPDGEAAIEEAATIIEGAKTTSELTKALHPLADEQLKQETDKIISKQKDLVGLLTRYPNKRKLAANYEGGIDSFIADLGSGSEITEYADGTYYLHVVDQQPPLKFDCIFIKFSTPEEGTKHPYTKRVETDNLLIMGVRDEVDQTFRSGTYFINPNGRLCAFREHSQAISQPKTPDELNLVSSSLDTMINKVSSTLEK